MSENIKCQFMTLEEVQHLKETMLNVFNYMAKESKGSYTLESRSKAARALTGLSDALVNLDDHVKMRLLKNKP